MSKLINQLKRQEGIRLNPYKCTSGKTTIGYGRNLDDKGITLYEAEILLEHDVNSVANALCCKVVGWHKLDQVRKDVLINMAFNIGVAGLMEFKKTLFYIEAGEFSEAAIEMMNSKWAKQVPIRAKELSKQMEAGKYS